VTCGVRDAIQGLVDIVAISSRIIAGLAALLLAVLRASLIALPEQIIDVLLALGVLTTATTLSPHTRWPLLLLFLLALGDDVRNVYPVPPLRNRREFPIIAGGSIVLAVVALSMTGLVQYLAVGVNLTGLYLYVRWLRGVAVGRTTLVYGLLSTLLGMAFVVVSQFPYLVVFFLILWIALVVLRMLELAEQQLAALNIEAALQQLGETLTTRTGVVFTVLVYAQLQLTTLLYSPTATLRAVEHLDAAQWFLIHSGIRDTNFYAYLLLVGLYGLAIFGFVALNLWFWGRAAIAGRQLLQEDSLPATDTKMPPWQHVLLSLPVSAVGFIPQLVLGHISTSFDPESAVRVGFAPIVAIAASKMYGNRLLVILLLDLGFLAMIIFIWRRWTFPSEVPFVRAATASFLVYTTALLILIHSDLLPIEAVDIQPTAIDVALLYPLIALFYLTAHFPERDSWLPLVGATVGVGSIALAGIGMEAITPSGIFLLAILCLAIRWIDLFSSEELMGDRR
jgi:hypothetical protein